MTQTSLPSCQGLRGGQPHHDNVSVMCDNFYFLLNVHFNFTIIYLLDADLRPESGSVCDFEARCGLYLYLHLLFKSRPALNITMI